MRRNARSIVATVTALTPLTALAVGEAARQYDEGNKVIYAKHQLMNSIRSSERKKVTISETSESNGVKASTWLGDAPPSFPYLLSISAGDDPKVVLDAYVVCVECGEVLTGCLIANVPSRLFEGVKVLGTYEERTCGTLARLTTPTSALQLLIRKIATHYSALRTAMNGSIPMDFGSSVGVNGVADDVTMDAVLRAMRDLQCSEIHDEERGQAKSSRAVPAILIRDFDAFSDLETERWLRWTHQVSSERLAHVVLLTSATVTPSKAQWLQLRHKNGLHSDSGGAQDFVGILLRPANSLVDVTSADDKLGKAAESHGLRLLSDSASAPPHNELAGGRSCAVSKESNKYLGEAEVILTTTGNWWSDISEVCRRLKGKRLNDVAHPDARLAVIHEVCNEFVGEIETGVLEALHLDGSLQLSSTLRLNSTDESALLADAVGQDIKFADTGKVLGALGAWKCFEALTGVTPVTGGSSFVRSPQQRLERKSKTPVNCVSAVDALLPFNYREAVEDKFLDLIDRQLLFLRPKNAVEIGVIPCQNAALVAPCWIQTRPVVKKTFEKIHRSETFYSVILDLDRYAASVEMQTEIEQYEREIAERRKVFSQREQDFAALRFSMTPAEKAQHEAELALIDVELQAKDVYLEKLRSLLTL